MWKLSWFLRDFGYDSDLLGKNEIDDKALVDLWGVVKVSEVTVHGMPVRSQCQNAVVVKETLEFHVGRLRHFNQKILRRRNPYSGCGVHHRLCTNSPGENGVDSVHECVYYSYGLRVSTRHARKS